MTPKQASRIAILARHDAADAKFEPKPEDLLKRAFKFGRPAATDEQCEVYAKAYAAAVETSKEV